MSNIPKMFSIQVLAAIAILLLTCLFFFYPLFNALIKWEPRGILKTYSSINQALFDGLDSTPSLMSLINLDDRKILAIDKDSIFYHDGKGMHNISLSEEHREALFDDQKYAIYYSDGQCSGVDSSFPPFIYTPHLITSERLERANYCFFTHAISLKKVNMPVVVREIRADLVKSILEAKEIVKDHHETLSTRKLL